MTTATALQFPSSANIRREVLDNGVVVLVYEKPSVESVVVVGSLTAGAIVNPPEQAGLAAFTAEALSYGTTNRDFNTFHTELELMAADLDADGGRFKTAFNGKALAEDLPNLLTLLSDMLRNPAFASDEIERLRGQLVTGIKYSLQDTRYLARRGFYEALYPVEHPYHYATQGTLETFEGLSVDDLRAYHAQYYGPKGMQLVIVGNVQADDAVNAVRDALGDWQNPGQPGMAAIPAPPVITAGNRVHTPVAGKTQSDLVLGFMGPSRYSDDYQAAVLANSILGQFGMMGRIGDIVREEKGLAYYSYSTLDAGHGQGPWMGVAGIAPDKVDEATDAMVNEFRRMAEEPVGDEDLENVQMYYTGSLPLQLESSRGIANTILRMESYKLGLDFLLSYQDMIMGITKDDIQRVAQHYIQPENVVVSVAGPA
jgi:zinc protease